MIHELSKAPFPYFGGKSMVAARVWPRFGNVPNLVDPFFGSGAMLLQRPHWDWDRLVWRDGKAPIETVNDQDGRAAVSLDRGVICPTAIGACYVRRLGACGYPCRDCRPGPYRRVFGPALSSGCWPRDGNVHARQRGRGPCGAGLGHRERRQSHATHCPLRLRITRDAPRLDDDALERQRRLWQSRQRAGQGE